MKDKITRLEDLFTERADGAIMCDGHVVFRKKSRKRIGRVPVRETLVEVRVSYPNGSQDDRVRLQILCNDDWQISGWPHAPDGEKRPREKSFVLDYHEVMAYEYQLGRLEGLVPGKGHRSGEEYGEMREAMTVVLKGTACDGRYSWDNGAPGKWRKLEELAMGLVFRFNDLCAAEERKSR